ncbi:MAG: hypothetical protein L0387_27525 [Acidobacteria bacterium]|nr:hypothetical protein [Acidobacteriota bacterium]MCI0724019.1 hypothetical protein [Acidobacteriota bacterium]
MELVNVFHELGSLLQTPSLFLLLSKTALIFLLCWFTGWSVCSRAAFQNPLSHWTITLGVGAALLNLAVIWASTLGGTGRLGMLVLALLLVVRLTWRRKAQNEPPWCAEKKTFVGFILVSILAVSGYLLPFLLKATSGFYSRGGGDHNTYLSLSEWFVDHRFWAPIKSEETIPPRPFFEVKDFVKKRQVFGWDRVQPLADQYLATPFMAVLPGAAEETYTAVVAAYLALSGWSCIIIVGELVQATAGRMLACAPLVMLSNLLLYVATSHSIPFLVAILFMNCALALYVSFIRSRHWELNASGLIPIGILSGALLAIYPHVFVLSAVLLVLFVAPAFRRLDWKPLVRFLTANLLLALILANLSLLINVPLVLKMLGSPGGVAKAYPSLQVIAAQSGIVDFGLFADPAGRTIRFWTALGSLTLVILVGFGISELKRLPRDSLLALVALQGICWFGVAYYNSKDFSYQMFRFSELGQCYLLALAGYGMIRLARRDRRQVAGLAVLGFVLTLGGLLFARSHIIAEVLGASSFQVEFRDAEQLKMVPTLQSDQEASGYDQRLIYYFGPGYGVDHAGASLLLRPTAYLAAHGFTYDPIFDRHLGGVRLWNDTWLKNSLLVVSSLSGGDIVLDARASNTPPKRRFAQLCVFDTRIQTTAQLVGDAWNVPISNPWPDSSPHRFRYLMGRTGALVIWSQAAERVRLSLLVHADTKEASLKLSGPGTRPERVRPVGPWTASAGSFDWISEKLELKPGPNVVLLTPQGELDRQPWCLFWEIKIEEIS